MFGVVSLLLNAGRLSWVDTLPVNCDCQSLQEISVSSSDVGKLMHEKKLMKANEKKSLKLCRTDMM
jgi:hypothetical protein